MNVVEKHGADWFWSEADGEIVFERYDGERDVVGLVHKKPSGIFSSCLYGKAKDYGSASPNWTSIRPQALFDDLEAAKNHVHLLIVDYPETD